LTLTDLSQLVVTCDIAEADVGAIKVGQIGTVSLSALSGRKFAATVSAIANTGTTSSDVVTYPVTLTIDNPTTAVKIGMSASVTVVTEQVDDALVVPSSAISGEGKTGRVTVRSSSGKETVVPVVVALQGSSTTAVYGDLSVGEEVVLPTVTITPNSASSSSSGTGLGSTGSFGGTGRFGGFGGGFGGGGGGFGGFGGRG
jgi:multidrug efflux pump subunit AcrA (membrane-fusion protein)